RKLSIVGAGPDRRLKKRRSAKRTSSERKLKDDAPRNGLGRTSLQIWAGRRRFPRFSYPVANCSFAALPACAAIGASLTTPYHLKKIGTAVGSVRHGAGEIRSPRPGRPRSRLDPSAGRPGQGLRRPLAPAGQAPDHRARPFRLALGGGD